MAENIYKGCRRRGFTTVCRTAAQDKRLSLKARGLFLLMQSLPENWKYTVSGLALAAGTGKDQIRSGLKELMETGYLVAEQSHDEDGKFAGNVFVLQEEAPLSENPTTVDESASPLSGNPSSEKPSTGNPSTENPTEQNNNINIIPPIVPQGTGAEERAEAAQMLFDSFWRAYPKKKGKEAARRAWKKLKPDMDLCRIMAKALRRQSKSEDWLREDGRFVPYPATWLNGRRWEDEPDGPTSDGGPGEEVQYI